ncbi:MAG: outer membrane protein assembly factor BamB family protein, partial [Deltaproteobacteria bacterium]
LALGDVDIELDLEGRLARLPGRAELPCEPAAVAAAILRAAGAFVAAAATENPRQRRNGYLEELVRTARDGLAECQDVMAPAPRAARRRPASAAPKAPPKADALAPGHLRRIAYRRRWSVDVRGLRGLRAASGLLLATTDGGAIALSPADGTLRWRGPPGDGTIEPVSEGGPRRGFIACADGAIARLDERGRVGWSVEPWSPGADIDSSCIVATVVAAASRGEIVASSLEDGRPLWRFSPPGCSSLKLSSQEGELIATTSDGRLYGIDARLGRLRFRARTGARPLGPPLLCGRLAFLPAQRPEGAVLVGVDLASGRRLPLEPPALGRTGALVATRHGLALAGSASGEGIVVGFTPEGALAWRSGSEGQTLGPGVPQLRPCAEGLLVRGTREVALLGEDGRPIWRRPFEEEAPLGPPPLIERGVALVAAEAGIVLLDIATGRLLGRAGDRQLLPDWLALGDELSIYCAEEDGPIVAFGLGTFLSLV